MGNYHGDFIWYELTTPDRRAAEDFYGPLTGWKFDSDPAYRRIEASEGHVGGILELTAEMTSAGAVPAWVGYVEVDDVDKMVGSIIAEGGRLHTPAHDLEGTARVAMVSDPQGAPLHVIEPVPPPGVENPESMAFSYDRPRLGHCAWNELATGDPAGARHFYGKHFGWVKDGEMDMGPLGKYEFLRHAGRAPDGSPMGHGVFGAVMPTPPGGASAAEWTFYFRVSDIDGAATAIAAQGGVVIQEPVEIPGGEYALVAGDPHGARFGLIGARNGS